MTARPAKATRAAADPETDLRGLQAVADNVPDKAGPRTKFTHSGRTFLLVLEGTEQAHGLYVEQTDRDGNKSGPKFICPPLHILAMTRDAKSGEWGRLLEWEDPDGRVHRWAMPMRALDGDFGLVLQELASKGLTVDPAPNARQMLQTYLKVWQVEERARCVHALGWFGGVYVLPDSAIGEAGERVVFQNGQALESALSQAGTVADWRDSVGRLAAGNSRPTFCIALAFAAPLLELSGVDSGGFHLRGDSSKGKSTAGIVAASVWGNPRSYVRQWRTTSNGTEGLAQLHNDGLLVLDEINQAKESDIGEIAYMLANGQGKTRAGRGGEARDAARWRLLFLSTGEKTLSAIMASAGKDVTAGQEIRMVDIEADAGARLGLYDQLNGAAGGADLSRRFTEAACSSFGTVGAEFLRRVVAHRADLAESLRASIDAFTAKHLPAGAAGQVERVARRFGLVAYAGELARMYGLVPWHPGDSTNAAAACFASWLVSFGGVGNREERALLRQVRGFFELHGASRFENKNADPENQRVPNRAGYVDHDSGPSSVYMVMQEVFRTEVISGYELRSAVQTLRKSGWLKTTKDGKATTPVRVGKRVDRLYVFTDEMWVTSDET